MNPAVCAACGKQLVVNRTGGQRKRFCDGVCRGKWHRTRRGEEPEPLAPGESDDDRLRTLLGLYGRLKADVEQYGTLIVTPTGSVRANPSVEALRRVIVELDRRGAPSQPAEEPADAVDAALRIA